jgi:hypothetical protein
LVAKKKRDIETMYPGKPAVVKKAIDEATVSGAFFDDALAPNDMEESAWPVGCGAGRSLGVPATSSQQGSPSTRFDYQ